MTDVTNRPLKGKIIKDWSLPENIIGLLQERLQQRAAELERLRAVNRELVEALERVINWLGRLAANAESQAQDTRFPSFAEANAADAKNYRATIRNLQAAIEKAKEDT